MHRFALIGTSGLSLLALGCPADTVDADTDTAPATSDSSSGEPPGDTTTSAAESTGEPPPMTDDGSSSSDGGSTDDGPPPPAVCGDGLVGGDENCDGTNLDGMDCIQQGFEGGELACDADCRHFDTSACFFFFCGNGTIQGDEICDGTATGAATCLTEGFESGTLSCNSNCSAFDTSTCGICGDMTLNGDEPCEGTDLDGHDCESEGYQGGTLACAADCTLDVSDCSVCGDGIANGFESCDLADLGGETCASLGLEGGTLGCQASCTYDFSMCDIVGIPFGNDGTYSGFELNTPVTPCDDISATGTATNLGDDTNIVVPIGFSFPFYGVQYVDANINSNGSVRFGDALEHSLANSCLPTASAATTNAIFAFWDDLNPSLGAGEVRYETLGPAGSQRFVVQWDTAHYSGDTLDLIRFQVVLHEGTGQVEVCYPDTLSAANVGNNGAEATSGIQQNSMVGLQYSCNTPDLVNGTYLFYIPN
jgi:hypothetical protein